MRLFRKVYPLEFGLKPFINQPPDSAYLTVCKGVEATGKFLRPNTPVTTVLSADSSYPRLLSNNYKLLLLDDYSIYEVNADWSLTKVGDVLAGTYWTYADFQKYIILSNGQSNYEYINGQVSPTTNMPIGRSLCRFRGRIISGGILSQWYDCDEGYIAWSDIGSKSFELSVKNEAGYLNAEIGEILRVDSDDELVYCYGTDGVAILWPHMQAFGFKRVSNKGIMFEGSACRNLFIDSTGTMCVVNKGVVQEVGFQHLFEGLNVAIEYDSSESAFYLLTNEKAYKFRDGNLSELNGTLRAVCRLGGSLIGIGHLTEGFEIWTDWLTFGVGGIKTLMSVEVLGEGFEGLQISAKIHYLESGIEQQIPFFDLAGTFTTLKASGDLLSIGLKGGFKDGFKLSGLGLNVQFADKRIIRGYAYDG